MRLPRLPDSLPGRRTTTGQSLAQRRGRRPERIRWGVGFSAVVVCVVGVAVTLGSLFAGWPLSGVYEPQAQPANQRPAFVRYVDPQGRFAVSYPRGWQRVPSSDPQVPLLVRTNPTSQDSMLVRVVQLDQKVTQKKLAAAKKITDALVKGSDVKVMGVQQIRLNGMPGFYYLYTFGKQGSDRYGIHAHYFLFSGSTMYVMVLQALPDNHFVQLAPIWDRIARSFQAPARSPSKSPAAGPPQGG